MASLNQIVKALADSVNQGDNHNLKERLKLSFKHRLAERLRQDAEKNGAAVDYAVTFTVDLEIVDFADDCNVETDCKVLKSTSTVPKPIRTKRPSTFMFVGSPDGVPIAQDTFWNVQDYAASRYMKKEEIAFYRNGYEYIYGNIKRDTITISDIFTSTNLIDVCNNGGSVSCYSDDAEFPAPEDMIESVKDQIRKSELLIVEENKSIEIDGDKENS